MEYILVRNTRCIIEDSLRFVRSDVPFNITSADREYIIADYLKSGENLKDEHYAYAKSNPDIDIKVITPHREYIEDFLDWYKE